MTTHPYARLIPERILNAVESTGLRCDASLLALNSYENRVYQVGIEDQAPVVVKFYRPQRWSDAAIGEEHAFCRELADAEIPVVCPIEDRARTLHHFEGFRFAIFPRRGGRWPNLEDKHTLRWLGRFLGRIHAVGCGREFDHRPTLDIDSFGRKPFEFLRKSHLIPPDLVSPYEGLVAQLLDQVSACYERAGPVQYIRLHGDCHPGNILWTDDGPHFVDFDDCRMGPRIQDLWMLLSGEHDEMSQQLRHVLAGYETFSSLDLRELHLIEALRTLRLIHYTAWLARRWEDPAFPIAFPWFNSQRFWQDHILALREQAALMTEPPLQVG